MLEEKVQNPGEFLFWFSLGSLCYGSKKWRWSIQRMKKSSRSIEGKDFPKFEMLDAKIASSLNEIIQNSCFKKKVSLNRKLRKRIGSFAEDRSLT